MPFKVQGSVLLHMSHIYQVSPICENTAYSSMYMCFVFSYCPIEFHIHFLNTLSIRNRWFYFFKFLAITSINIYTFHYGIMWAFLWDIFLVMVIAHTVDQFYCMLPDCSRTDCILPSTGLEHPFLYLFSCDVVIISANLSFFYSFHLWFN